MKLNMKFRKAHKWKYVLLAFYFITIIVYPFFTFNSEHNEAKSIVGFFVTEEEDALFKDYIRKIQSGEVEQAYSQLHPEIQKAFPIGELEKVAQFVSSSTDAMEAVGANVNTFKDGDGSRTNYEMTYEIANNDLQYPYVLASINALKENDKMLITGFHAYAQTESIKNQQKIDWRNQWSLIVIAIAIPLLIAITALHYLSNAVQPRWLVLIMILVLSIYITVTGDMYGATFGFRSFATSDGLWGPFVFNTPIPLGALIYWVRKKKFLEWKKKVDTITGN